MSNIEESIPKDPNNIPVLNQLDNKFTSDVIQRSDVNLGLCWHCNCCAGGCPFAEAMDYHPNSVIRLVQLGFKKKALESSAIWICVGCNT